LIVHIVARDDFQQNLLFGFWTLSIPDEETETGVFYDGESLTDAELTKLKSYAITNSLPIIDRNEFLEKFYLVAWETDFSLVSAWDFPFFASRLAYGYSEAKGRFRNGFSFHFWQWRNPKTGKLQRDRRRPSIRIKSLGDSCKIAFTKTTRYRGNSLKNLLDAGTLAAALCGEPQTMKEACLSFGVHLDDDIRQLLHEITIDSIGKLHAETTALQSLTDKLIEEHSRYSIPLSVTETYSSASIAKAHLKAMGIPPILHRQPEFSDEYLGYGTSRLFGGRAGVPIRYLYVPSVEVDFKSNYATASCLAGGWDFLTADEIQVRTGCINQVTALLKSILSDPGQLYYPAIWNKLNAFVRIDPRGEPLPARVKSHRETWYSSVAPLSGNGNTFWYPLADIVSAILLGYRKLPKIIDAFYLVPSKKKLSTLRPIKLLGQLDIDPRTDDFFKKAVEERHRIKARLKSMDLASAEATDLRRQAQLLKFIGNISAYGLFGEFIREDARDDDGNLLMMCYGKDGPFLSEVRAKEVPGSYCFPPLAAIVTADARLLMAMLERAVQDEGTCYSMEAIDSMAIVATPKGGTEGLPREVAESLAKEGITPISFAQVEAIRHSFETLNPYAPDAVPGSILGVKLDSLSRQIYGRAISVNLHAFFERRDDRFIVLDEDDSYSTHTLGTYLDPRGSGHGTGWIAEVWNGTAEGLSKIPAVQIFPLSTRNMMNLFSHYNDKRPYRNQLKPFSALMKCDLAPSIANVPSILVKPLTYDPEMWIEGWLRAQFQRDPIKRYPPIECKVTTDLDRLHIDGAWENTVLAVSYESVSKAAHSREEYRYRDRDNNECTPETRGRLFRVPVEVGDVKGIGKELNELQLWDLGLARADEQYVMYTAQATQQKVRDELPCFLSISEVSRLADVDRATVRKLINNSSPVASRSLKKISDAINKWKSEQRTQGNGPAAR
jgi:hypothetical protein